MHKHHIIPRHMGGTDDPSNIIEVTVEQHAELHFALYLECGRWQDYIAAHGLAGLISSEEAHRQATSLAHKGKTPRNKGKKTGPNSKMSAAAKTRLRGPISQAHKDAISRANTGRKRPDQSERIKQYNETTGKHHPRDHNGRFKKCTSTE